MQKFSDFATTMQNSEQMDVDKVDSTILIVLSIKPADQPAETL
ncbi:hypothetical protein [Bradyrhizobium australiense]|nr:hypothetical protein [Bradyrhizobium australiense]